MNILAVVVRYKTPIEQSQTLHSLTEAFHEHPELLASYSILLWDNSPVPLDNPQLPFPFEYGVSQQNPGVAGAYNHALTHAEAIDCPWLLLLDQDTTVSADYLRRMLQHATELRNDQSIATIVPFVRSHGMLVSPQRFGRFVRNAQIPRSTSGIYRQPAYAMNSGMVMRTSALRTVGGYSEEFWLDFSDIYIFQVLQHHGMLMYIAGELELPHSVTMLDFDRDMTPERYRNFLAAENLFLGLYRSRALNWFQTAWLLARAARQFRRYKNKQFARITLEFLAERIFRSKSSRLQNWRTILNSHRGISASDSKAAR